MTEWQRLEEFFVVAYPCITLGFWFVIALVAWHANGNR